MMVGDVERETHGLREVASLVMRANLYRFHFSIAGGVLPQNEPPASIPVLSMQLQPTQHQPES
jgi:hypothetical protein